jgi:hypothetical protein
MKQRHRAALASLLAAGTLLAFAAARAEKLESANALFSSTDPSGCITTEVFVLVSRGALGSHSKRHGASVQRSIRISQVDACREMQVVNAFGSVPGTGRGFELDNDLKSARFTARIPVFDEVTQRTFDIHVNLAWSGQGDLINTANDIHFESPGVSVVEGSEFQERIRFAQASGGVFLNATNFTPELSADAEISSSQ